MRNVFLFGMAFALTMSGCSKAIIDEGPEEVITEEVVYDSDVENIMTNYCITCHGGTSPSASLLLNNYADVKAAGESGKLIDRMNNSSNPMPPSGLISSEERSKIEKWVSDGFPKQ